MAKSKKGPEGGTTTPLMQQYISVKTKYPDAVLLFRVGDFYETFGEDAVKASRALGITLTSRNNGGSDVELAGFPYHSLDMYLPRLVRAGYRVAICEQMEKPVPGKVVRRSVTEVVTPGVTTDDALLDHSANNFLATLAYGPNDHFGAAFLDISTGEFFVSEGDSGTVDKLLQSFKPAEIVLPKSRLKEFSAVYGDKFYTNTLEDWIFTRDFAREKLIQHFQTASLKGFGIEELDLAQTAAGAALHYLAATENNKLGHILGISRLQTEQYVWLDRFTIRNLELISSNHENGRSLLHVLDRTVSPMGARLLKKWILLPLTNRAQIQERHDAVQFFLESADLTGQLEHYIRQMGDLERLMSKTAVGKVNPREVLQLRRALEATGSLKNLLQNLSPSPSPTGRGVGAPAAHAESVHTPPGWGGAEGEVPAAVTGYKGEKFYKTDPERWKILKDFVLSMRKQPTEAESILWELLRAKQQAGIKFRRQHAIEDFIADFVSLEYRLVIEVDGDIHLEQQEYDQYRTEYLNACGYEVIRFHNNEVVNNPNDVVNKILQKIGQIAAAEIDPSPSPAPTERGENPAPSPTERRVGAPAAHAESVHTPPGWGGAGGGVPAALVRLAEGLNPCPSLYERIERDIAPDPPADIRKGNAMADNCHPELAELRHLVRNSRDLLLEIQQREIERTGISSLKIAFNNVFGYYIEVTSKWKDQVPPEWTRKQTIANGERYITEELKILEAKILGAEEKIQELEERLFRDLVDTIASYIQPVQLNAQIVARLDCLLSFARVAEKHQYIRPQVDDSTLLDIREGRHPVIETLLPVGEPYVPNDVYLDNETVQIILITGPNMAGKSALLRQTDLIALMAQMGSFVPAQSARIGLVDKVFTRVGASDNISGGESTFMVEMNETALIMNNISDRSLILLDEIGRGTSTYDGISIAWSLAEYLHDNGKARPKTLFATHYHELNELSDSHERIHNYHISTREAGHKVIFLRKLAPGGSNHSFGIHVARMAGMPQHIVERASEILKTLEEKSVDNSSANSTEKAQPASENLKKKVKNIGAPLQLHIFDVDDYTLKIKETLLSLDLNTMTPMDALWKLNELVKIANKK
ncbi:MAG: DNA mismatch repair protein MutS [Saprospiraceae bacterium]|nr:DNA mismatch repair protein MutS [Saprospiraceae bacterium]